MTGSIHCVCRSSIKSSSDERRQRADAVAGSIVRGRLGQTLGGYTRDGHAITMRCDVSQPSHHGVGEGDLQSLAHGHLLVSGFGRCCASVVNDPGPAKPANEFEGPPVALLGPVHLRMKSQGLRELFFGVAEGAAPRSRGALPRHSDRTAPGGVHLVYTAVLVAPGRVVVQRSASTAGVASSAWGWDDLLWCG